MKRLHLKIFGQVQGVFYRAEAQKKARELGLLGYVKNTDDGCVEIIAEGDEEDLISLLNWCKVGSSLARVMKVEEEWVEVQEVSYIDFKIRF